MSSFTRPCLAAALLAGSGTWAGAQEMPVYALSDWGYYNNRAWRWVEEGELPKAERALGLAIKTMLPFQNTHSRLLARSYRDLAWVLYLEHRSREAEPLGQWALGVCEKDRRATPDSLYQCLFMLAVIKRDLKKPVEAVPLLARALEVQQSAVGEDHPATADTMMELAGAEMDSGRYLEAGELLGRIASIQERMGPLARADLARTLVIQAEVKTRLKKEREAEALRKRSLTMRDDRAPRQVAKATVLSRPRIGGAQGVPAMAPAGSTRPPARSADSSARSSSLPSNRLASIRNS